MNVGRSVSLFLLLYTRTVNIPVLIAMFFSQLGTCFLFKHDCVTQAILVCADGMLWECVCMCVICMCACQTTQLKMRYGQQDGSESAVCRWVLFYCHVEEYLKTAAHSLLSALLFRLPCTKAPLGLPQLPVVLTGSLAASCHTDQLGKLLLKLQPIGLVLHFLARNVLLYARI